LTSPFDLAEQASAALRASGAARPELGLLLGSGLAAVADELDPDLEVAYEDLPGFSATTVKGHGGRALVGTLGGRRTIVLSGRLHAYEGHAPDALLHPVRTLGRLGVPALLVTCAAGGIREDLGPGALVAITDHLNLAGEDPLRGPHDERLGPRFPDLVDAYDPALRDALRRAAEEAGIVLAEGTYARVAGPCYETPAEIRMLRLLGADLVGMSVVPEVVAARQAGIRCAALAAVTNRAAGLGEAPPSHDEVLAAGESAAGAVTSILGRLAGVGWCA
jgi:inosine/guanosine/xanthosine phosphorylase family protein